MRSWVRILGGSLGVGVLLGGVLVTIGPWRKSATPVAVKPGVVSLNDTPTTSRAGGQVTPGLSVTASGNQGLASQSLSAGQTGEGTAGTAGGSGGSDASSGSGQLPTPSQFHAYDQYKNNPTAMYIDAKPGSGKAIGQGSEVTVQYRGWLTDGKEFDESYARGKPYSFKEGDGSVILGLAEAMFGMKEGGLRRLIIPPAVGYGAAGHDPIPPDSVLIFDVELIQVQ